MNINTLSRVNYAMEHALSYREIFDHIMSYVPEDNVFGYGRVENIELSIKIISISRKFRRWFCCSDQGPYKFSAKAIIELIGDTPLPLRVFLGKLNLKLVEDVNASFQNLEKIKKAPDPISLWICPDVRNFENQTPIDLSISMFLQNPEKYHFFLNGLYEEASAKALAEALPNIFIHTINPRQERHNLADVFIEKIIKKTGSAQLAIEALQPHLGKILSFRSKKDLELSYAWIKQKGFSLNADAINEFFINSTKCIFNQEIADSFLEIMEKLCMSENVAVDTPVRDGNHLIHTILTGISGRNDRKKYLHLILKKAPHEIHAENSEGEPLITAFFSVRNVELIGDLKPYLTESVLWQQREGCHEFIKTRVRASKVKHGVFSPDPHETLILDYLANIKKLFSSRRKFEEWLVSPSSHGDCLLHHLAKWSSALINEMVALDFFTKDKLKCKDNHNQTVLRLQNLYQQLVEISHGSSNRDLLRLIVVEIPELMDPQFLFRLLRIAFFSTEEKDKHLLSELLHIQGCNDKDKNGDTLLHRLLSKKFRRLKMTRMKAAIAFLIDRGADPKITNDRNETVFDLAVKNGWESLLGMLK